MLELIINNILESKHISKYIVATSNSIIDDEIYNLCNKLKIDCYRGSELDVLSRFEIVSQKYNADLPDIKEEVVGSAEVQSIFKVSKIGKVAGSKVINGEIINNQNARLIRDGNVLYTGFIGSIFREKNAAKQVAAGLECGITLKDFADYKEKDVIEVYKVTETERRIND